MILYPYFRYFESNDMKDYPANLCQITFLSWKGNQLCLFFYPFSQPFYLLPIPWCMFPHRRVSRLSLCHTTTFKITMAGLGSQWYPTTFYIFQMQTHIPFSYPIERHVSKISLSFIWKLNKLHFWFIKHSEHENCNWMYERRSDNTLRFEMKRLHNVPVEALDWENLED